LFAKILLDKIARAIEFYFGTVPDSHDDFVKHLDRYVRAKDLSLPRGFKQDLQGLKREISDFRDYQIAHEKSPDSTSAEEKAEYPELGCFRTEGVTRVEPVCDYAGLKSFTQSIQRKEGVTPASTTAPVCAKHQGQ
jgi:hypothetical protein